MNHCRRVVSMMLVGLALPFGHALAQDPGLGPQSSLVQLDQQCVFSSTPLEVDGEVVVLWEKRPSGILGRRGPGLDSLGPATTLVAERVNGFQAIALPGGFAILWMTDDWPPRRLTFQRFDADLSPAAPPVVLESEDFTFWQAIDLRADAGGGIALAWAPYSKKEVRLQRFSAADQPLGPVTIIPMPPAAAEVDEIELGASSLLVAWREQLDPTPTWRLFTRAFSLAGVPQDAAIDHGTGTFQLRVSMAATEDGGFLSMVTRDDLFLRLLGPSGSPLEPEIALGLSTEAREPLLAVSGSAAWITWRTDSGNLFLNRFDLGSRTTESSLLVAEHLDGLFPSADRLEPSGAGVLLGWRQGYVPIILPDPCDFGFSTHARAFGPDPGVVEVPTLSDLGLALCALLFAVAGLSIRRAA
jgi:hypothetical protein